MKKLVLTALIGFAMVGFTGCTQSNDAKVNTKCAANGKCASGNKCKTKKMTKKCAANGKCSAGKCNK
ncbi:MAG: hypothetical protein DSZ12_04700 [Sulfurovum sp.]|nr:MAG: hypothetical protein DSZ08_03705 [Sulfurovum sp.]RUM74886.1 MAG: hypothetical protein DSZ12_04700 [Sulfurovum sp.]